MKFFSIEDFDNSNDTDVTEEGDSAFIRERDCTNKELSQTIKRICEYEPEIKVIVFKNCVFNKVSFKNAVINQSLKFENCTFEGEVLFKDCTFNDDLNFSGSVFCKNTLFDNCCYNSCYFDFIGIRTKNTCKSFAIVNTQHQQRFDKPAYTILNFSNAVFESVVAFNELTDLSFCFCDTTFKNEFYFSNTLLGLKTLFGDVNYPVVDTKEKKMKLKLCLQNLFEALRKRESLACEADMVKKKIEDIMNTKLATITKETYTEQEMCDYVKIGRATFQKMKSAVKQGKKDLLLPEPFKTKPLMYSREEVEKFKNALMEMKIRKDNI